MRKRRVQLFNDFTARQLSFLKRQINIFVHICGQNSRPAEDRGDKICLYARSLSRKEDNAG